MSLYDSSDSQLQQRMFLGTKVYMASHPVMRPLVRGGNRPTEFGDRVWDMTLAMMHYLDRERFGRVVDVGCGWGLLGIHLARNPHNDVTCVDIDGNLQPIVEAHARLNEVSVSFRSSSFKDIPFDQLQPEVIVAAEVCYCESVGRELCTMMDRAARSGVSRAIIADLGRPDFFDFTAYCRERFKVDMSELSLETHSKPRPLMTVHF